MTRTLTIFSVSALTAAFSEVAFGYVGPGAGLSLVGALWGLLVAVVVAFGFIVVWPIRRMRRRRAADRLDAENGSDPESDEPVVKKRTGQEAS